MRNPGPLLPPVTLAGLLVLALGTPLAAVDGAPDPSFNGNGRTAVDIGQNARVRAVAAFPDGKVVAVGDVTVPQPGDASNTSMFVVRWNVDGTPDTTFGPAQTGVVTIDFDLGPPGLRFDDATSVAVQPDGKVIVGGYARAGQSEFYVAVARLTVSGVLDSSFAGDGKLTFPELGTSRGCAVRLRRGGQILVTPTLYSGDNLVLQLTSAGDPDPSYGFGGQTETWSCGSFGCGWFVDALELPGDGQLLALGTTPSRDRFFLVRFLGEEGGPGELDGFFGIGGVATFIPSGFEKVDLLGFALDPSGRVTIGAYDGNNPSRTALLRLLHDQPDPAFGTGGWASFTFKPPSSPTTGHALAMLVQADGKPVLAGIGLVDGTWNFVVTRRTPDGSAVDSTFSGGWPAVAFDIGGGLTDGATAIGAHAGRPLAGGLAQSSSTSLVAMARLDNALVWTDGFESGSTFFWEKSP